MADVTGRARYFSSILGAPLLNIDNCILMVGCVIILKESIRFRAATKRTAYTKDKLL